jgi:hypothetical protein
MQYLSREYLQSANREYWNLTKGVGWTSEGETVRQALANGASVYAL